MMKSRIENKCIFCKYWEGSKARRSKQHGCWEYENDSAMCIKNRGTKLHATHHCPYFELDEYTYFD